MLRETMKKLWHKCRSLDREVALWLAACSAGLAVLSTQMAMMPRPAPESQPVVARELSEAADGARDVDLLKVTEYLVDAVIQVESGGRPRKVGRAGERGVMQIKRSTWNQTTRRLHGRSLPFDRAFDPAANRRVGRAYMAELHAFLQEHRAQWRSDERALLLACYNAGPARVRAARFDVRRLPTSVRSYVERASALHDYYLAGDAQKIRALLAGGSPAGASASPTG